MKHINEFNIFDPFNSKIKSICKRYGIRNYSINKDGSIDVDGDVQICRYAFDKLPLRFRNVTGNFYCYMNGLRTLEGCPTSIGENFNCYMNRLTSLKGGPTSVGLDYFCGPNELTTLEGAPSYVGRDFNCSDNHLTSLIGCPNPIGGGLNCNYNKIISFEGCPTLNNSRGYRDKFTCENNPLDNVWSMFEDYSKIELFNDYDIIQDDKIIIERLNDFLREIGKPTVEKVKGYINI